LQAGVYLYSGDALDVGTCALETPSKQSGSTLPASVPCTPTAYYSVWPACVSVCVYGDASLLLDEDEKSYITFHFIHFLWMNIILSHTVPRTVI